MKNTGFFWIFSWLIFVFLGCDFWNWGKTTELIFGLPTWIVQEIFLVLLFALVMLFLVRYAWGKK